MKPSHRTPKTENPGSGGRGAVRRELAVMPNAADEAAAAYIDWVYAHPGMAPVEYAVELAKRMQVLIDAAPRAKIA